MSNRPIATINMIGSVRANSVIACPAAFRDMSFFLPIAMYILYRKTSRINLKVFNQKLNVELAHAQDFVEPIPKRLHHSRVEQLPALLDNQLQRLLDRDLILIRSLGRQGVEDIRHGANPPTQRDPLAPQCSRVARAIPALVMGQGDQLASLQQRRRRSAQHFRADRPMALYQLPLVNSELAGLC